MANIKSAKKAIRVSNRRNAINSRVRTDMRVARKSVLTALEKNDIASGKKNLAFAYSKIDTAVKKGVVKKGTASRYKSRLAAAVKKADTSK